MNGSVTKKENKCLLGAAIGNCVHVAGVANFLRSAETRGFKSELLGAAVDVQSLARAIEELKPHCVCVGYRLTPDNCKNVLDELQVELNRIDYRGLLFFGGTKKTAEVAKATGAFDVLFDGSESEQRIMAALTMIETGEALQRVELVINDRDPIQSAVDRLSPLRDPAYRMPLLRHHFGLPSLKETIDGIEKIAESEVLDVISIAPDQNAQEFYFDQSVMDSAFDGAGGVPIRSEDHLLAMDKARKVGNHPYLRIYSGTRDLKRWAEMSVRTIDNAWCAIPLTWYSELDNRSRRPVADAIRENMEVMRWYAELGKPVEINESHHWSLREAPDAVAIAMAYISAYVARKLGVKQYFAQYMFNTPMFTSVTHDIAKMSAKVVLVESLARDDFTPYRQVRAGLSHFSTDLDVAKGQLGMMTATMMAFKPHILHIVGYTEGDHAATVDEVIESAKIVRGALQNLQWGAPSPFVDAEVENKAKTLIREARCVLAAITMLGGQMGSDDPLADPEVIARAINVGMLDAPHLKGQSCACGAVKTAFNDGGCVAIDTNRSVVNERARLGPIVEKLGMNAAQLDDDRSPVYQIQSLAGIKS